MFYNLSSLSQREKSEGWKSHTETKRERGERYTEIKREREG